MWWYHNVECATGTTLNFKARPAKKGGKTTPYRLEKMVPQKPWVLFLFRPEKDGVTFHRDPLCLAELVLNDRETTTDDPGMS